MSTCKFLKSILLYIVLLSLLACELQVPNEFVVNIITPQDGQSFKVGETITFTGSATDPLNGALRGESLVWTSSIEGEIGTGNDFSRDNLSSGSHTITMTALNSMGESETDSVTITVLSEEVQHLQLESQSFADGEIIPIKYTCDGDDLSPNVSWPNIPEGTASFVIIMEDPDAPFGTFTHWVVFDIPDSVNNLEEGFPEKRQTEGIKEGLNDFSSTGYKGPCPPKGDNFHRYFIRLYSLDVAMLGLPEGAVRGAVESKMEGHIRGEAILTGKYKR